MRTVATCRHGQDHAAACKRAESAVEDFIGRVSLRAKRFYTFFAVTITAETGQGSEKNSATASNACE